MDQRKKVFGIFSRSGMLWNAKSDRADAEARVGEDGELVELVELRPGEVVVSAETVKLIRGLAANVRLFHPPEDQKTVALAERVWSEFRELEVTWVKRRASS